MLRSLFVCFLLGLSLMPLNGLAGNFMSNGPVNSSSGVPDRDLKYENFEITEDGYIMGYIVNTSGRTRSGIRLDIWTTNMQETRIFWRKSLNIGDLGPNARYMVKEPYRVDNEDPARTKFMFRIPSGSNYRNN